MGYRIQDLSPQRWRRIEALLDEVLERDAAERRAYLERACPDDAALRTTVEELLSADAAAGAFLEQPVEVWASALFDDVRPELRPPSAPESGTRVGPYRLVRELGRGGMGVVYLAERADGQFEQQVALKLIAHPDTERVLQRFLSERQILARLHHPHIARLLDGGVTEDGWPYFVMEYVEGQPITAYCDAVANSVEARVRLLRTVCEAVQHAHRNLVVHRDLKPDNILVTETAEGHPRVKVLDFGIAKILHSDGTSAPLTRADGVMMTPTYAAPEQVRGASISTATDVYQLGVLAYELLSGRRPYRFETRTPAEVVQNVCEAIPEPPSRAVGRERASDAPALRRRLQGDLDAVVMKALSKDPEARYASAGALADDLRRHLNDLPVMARPPAAGYRLRKFFSRHRWGVAVAAAFFVFAIGFTVLYTTRVAAERDRAQQEAQKATRVSAFLVGLFGPSSPFEAPTDTITVREYLARGVERLEGLDDQPAVQAQLYEALGNAYQRLGRYQQAEPLLRQAVAIWRTQPSERAAALARGLNALGELRREQGALAEAETLYREALALRRAILSPDHLDLAESLNNLGLALDARARHEAAEAHYRQALAILHASEVDSTGLEADLLNNLSMLLLDTGKYEAAKTLQRESLAAARAAYGENDLHLGIGFNNLGLINSKLEDYPAAESLYTKALALWRSRLGEDHPYVSYGMSNLGVVLDKRGKYAAAESMKREVLARHRRLLGDDHPEVAKALGNLAITLAKRGDYAAAEALHREELALLRRVQGPEHPGVARALYNLAWVLQKQGAYEAAERAALNALALRRRVLRDGHPDTRTSLKSLAELYEAWGRTDRAAAYRDTLATIGS